MASKYSATIPPVKITKEVKEAMQKKVIQKKKLFPRYNECDLIRSAIVNSLKKDDYLQKGKDYL